MINIKTEVMRRRVYYKIISNLHAACILCNTSVLPWKMEYKKYTYKNISNEELAGHSLSNKKY